MRLLLCGTEHGSLSAGGLVSRGVAGSRRVLQLPLPLWTVDGRGVVPHACPTGQCVPTLLGRCGWEGVGAVACPTGQTRPTLFGVGDLLRARKPDEADLLRARKPDEAGA